MGIASPPRGSSQQEKKPQKLTFGPKPRGQAAARGPIKAYFGDFGNRQARRWPRTTSTGGEEPPRHAQTSPGQHLLINGREFPARLTRVLPAQQLSTFFANFSRRKRQKESGRRALKPPGALTSPPLGLAPRASPVSAQEQDGLHSSPTFGSPTLIFVKPLLQHRPRLALSWA